MDNTPIISYLPQDLGYDPKKLVLQPPALKFMARIRIVMSDGRHMTIRPDDSLIPNYLDMSISTTRSSVVLLEREGYRFSEPSTKTERELLVGISARDADEDDRSWDTINSPKARAHRLASMRSH